MKKLVLSLVLGASLTIVPSAFALKAMTADNMKDTTGQAGVSILIDDVIIFQSSAATTTYTDMDGSFSGTVAAADSSRGGSLTIATEMPEGVLTTLRCVGEFGTRNGFLQQDYASILQSAGIKNIGVGMDGLDEVDNTSFVAGNALGFIGRPLTIDVSGQLRMASYGYSMNIDGTTDSTRIAGIAIGLPTLEINKVDLGQTTKIITISSNTGTSAQEGLKAYGFREYGTEYIRITKSGTSTTAILGGQLEICPH
jgi:hypothetical protein